MIEGEIYGMEISRRMVGDNPWIVPELLSIIGYRDNGER